MRRFSQRNSLVTLNEINITPLLDLAFVLLLIFIITRPMLEQSMDLKLPKVDGLEVFPGPGIPAFHLRRDMSSRRGRLDVQAARIRG